MRRLAVLVAALVGLLAPGGPAQSGRATFHGKNGLLVFSASVSAPNALGLFVANPDGTHLKQVTNPTADDLSARVSPNGRQLAFTRCTDFTAPGGCQIFVVNVDGTGLEELTVAGTNSHPAWSPDGKRIAFTSVRGGPSAIDVMNADGSNQMQLTSPTPPTSWADGEPDWSPDGSRIAFVRTVGPPGVPDNSGCDVGQSGASDVWVMGADGSNQQQLLVGDNSFGPNHCLGPPRFSPDGTKVLVEVGGEALFDAGAQLGVGTLGGGVPAAISTGVPSSASPTWSPDGTEILFQSVSYPFKPGPVGFYTVPPGGGSPTLLTVAGLPGQAFLDDWGPAAAVPTVAKKKLPLCKKGQKSTKKHPCRKR